MSTSQQSTSTAENSLAAPFHAETKLVATIPTTAGAASAVAAHDSNSAVGNPLHGEAGLVLASLGDTAPNSAAVMSNSHEPSMPQCHPLLNRGCNEKGTVATAAAQPEASLAPKTSNSKQGAAGRQPSPKTSTDSHPGSKYAAVQSTADAGYV